MPIVADHIGVAMATRVEDGLLTGIYSVRNPGKLTYLEREATLRC
jgi:RNA polymerase sigma-70 factor, ECF subfamily